MTNKTENSSHITFDRRVQNIVDNQYVKTSTQRLYKDIDNLSNYINSKRNEMTQAEQVSLDRLNSDNQSNATSLAKLSFDLTMRRKKS